MGLKKYLVERKKDALKNGWGEPPEWLFYNEDGGRIDINNVRNRVFHKALEKAKLWQIRVHDLRHTYTTLRISKGDDILDFSRQLGYHSVKLTLNTYCPWMPGTKKAEVNGLDSEAPTCTPGAPTSPESNKKEADEVANLMF